MTPDDTNPSDTEPHVEVCYVCADCSAERWVKDGDRNPTCGELKDETTEWPNGGWIRTQVYTPHKPMIRTVRTRQSNIFADLINDTPDD